MSVHPQAKIQSRIYLHLKKKVAGKATWKQKIGERERSKAEGYMLLERGRAQRRTLYNTTYRNIIN